MPAVDGELLALRDAKPLPPTENKPVPLGNGTDRCGSKTGTPPSQPARSGQVTAQADQLVPPASGVRRAR